jgi:hypothetical protein
MQIGNLYSDLESARFYINGQEIDLTKTERKILILLTKNFNKKIVSFDSLITFLYYSADDIKDEPESNTVKVLVHKLKHKLHRLSANKLTIKSHYGDGWSLLLKDSTIPKHYIYYNSKLSFNDINKIYELKNSGLSCYKIAKIYNVSKIRIQELIAIKERPQFSYNNSGQYKLSPKDVMEIRELRLQGKSYMDITKLFPCCRANIVRIVKRQIWKNVA